MLRSWFFAFLILLPLYISNIYSAKLTSDALNFVVNTVVINTLLCLVRNLMHQTLYQNWENITEKCKWNKNCRECYIWINFIAFWLNENRRSAFFQWQQFCTCVPNQHQLALGWYFFVLALLSGRKPDLCCTSIIENSKEKTGMFSDIHAQKC